MIWYGLGFIVVAGIAIHNDVAGMVALLVYWFIGVMVLGDDDIGKKVDYKERFKEYSKRRTKTIIIDYDEDTKQFTETKVEM